MFALIAVALIVLAVIVYQRTLPPIGSPRRRLLATIRAVVLVMILFLIFEPVLRWLDRNEERAKILLLVDRSASMSISDNGIVRDSLVENFLRRSELAYLSSRGELRTFVFGDTAVQMSLDSIKMSAASYVGTNPAGAWIAARSATSSEDIGAVVILTDGAHNSGPNPERAATESGVPIYTVGVGDTTLRRDGLIADLLTNDIAYKGTQVPVRVRVRAQGVAGKTSRLHLLDSRSRTLLNESVSFEGSLYEKTYDATFTAEKEGELRITAILDSIAGELTTENNRRSRVVRILDSKYNVLIVAGKPSPDVTYLRQSLGQDTTIEVDAYVEAKNGLVGNRSFSQETVDNAELIVFVDYPTNASNRQLWDAVANRLNQDGVPLLYQHGPDVSQATLSKIATRLPVEFQPQASFSNVLLRDASSHAAISARVALPASTSDLLPTQGSVCNYTTKSSTDTVASF